MIKVDSIWNVIASRDDRTTASGKLAVAAHPNVELMLVVAMLAAPTPSPAHYGTLDHPNRKGM